MSLHYITDVQFNPVSQIKPAPLSHRITDTVVCKWNLQDGDSSNTHQPIGGSHPAVQCDDSEMH